MVLSSCQDKYIVVVTVSITNRNVFAVKVFAVSVYMLHDS